MPKEPQSNVRSGSTTWEWQKVRVRAGSAPAGDSPPQGVAPKPLRRRDHHKPLTVVVRYRGGPQCSWLISYRGKSHRFEGWLALHDVLTALSDSDTAKWQSDCQ